LKLIRIHNTGYLARGSFSPLADAKLWKTKN
jgi:hypothetical protein